MRPSLAWLAASSTGRSPFCLLELLAQVPGHFCVNVVEERLNRYAGKPLDRVDGRSNLCSQLAVELRVGRRRTSGDDVQMPAQAIDGIFGGPRQLFLGRAVAPGIVARRVWAHPICHRLDERRAVPRASSVKRVADDRVEREK